MKTKNYVFVLLLIVLIISNVFLFPKLDFYINYSTYLSIVIGILGAVFAFNIFKETKLAQNKSLIAFFLPIVIFFGLTLFNVFYPVNVEDEILQKNGIETIAQITDKTHMEFRRAETFEFNIQFKNQNGEIIETKVSTLANEYNDHNIGDIIKVKYSSENNQLVRVIND
jgi:hypothetical protein